MSIKAVEEVLKEAWGRRIRNKMKKTEHIIRGSVKINWGLYTPVENIT